MVAGLDFFIVNMITRRERIPAVREWYQYSRNRQRKIGRAPVCSQGKIPGGNCVRLRELLQREQCEQRPTPDPARTSSATDTRDEFRRQDMKLLIRCDDDESSTTFRDQK